MTDTAKQTLRLIEIMAALRTPGTGCPWDLEQDFASIAPYTIEEAYEVADAIERGDMADLKEELGDLLLQVVFHARMAEEDGAFGFADVAQAISDKMEARHPHVFGGAEVADAAAQTNAWEEMKAKERAQKSTNGALDGVALNLPALMRSEKLQKRAARQGFDWPNADDVLPKFQEEIEELQEAAQTQDDGKMLEEAGDLLFTCVNYVRKMGIDPEQALRQANGKFTRRYKVMEGISKAEKRDMKAMALDELESLWQQAKASD